MKINALVSALALSLVFSLIPLTSSMAVTKCPSPKADGLTVGKIRVEDVIVNVKNVDYPLGKDLNPPKSPLNAGVSIRHQPLSSESGSSLIVWHVNYKGCQGKLNVINNKRRGYEFEVIDESGESVRYKIFKRIQVKKGEYDPEWFLLSGPRQLVLVTCTGRVVNRSYTDNLVIIATPV